MFLTFSPPFPHPELFNMVRRKILSKLFQSKVSSDEAKGKLNLPQKHSHAEMLDASAPELGIQGNYKQQDVHAVCGGDHRVSHALDTSGANLSEQKSSFSSMMW